MALSSMNNTPPAHAKKPGRAVSRIKALQFPTSNPSSVKNPITNP